MYSLTNFYFQLADKVTSLLTPLYNSDGSVYSQAASVLFRLAGVNHIGSTHKLHGANGHSSSKREDLSSAFLEPVDKDYYNFDLYVAMMTKPKVVKKLHNSHLKSGGCCLNCKDRYEFGVLPSKK